ncbi:hypothetical protein RRG08_002413 [Elysia crispata]|uniref:Uncharacterized protein n=1 Tax=Elysia crispata TaxID=231223 RepID=A0AAE0ZHR2_9GAST|nr:hypothetical protein RRG08_002413 [Elysia crispata]
MREVSLSRAATQPAASFTPFGAEGERCEMEINVTEHHRNFTFSPGHQRGSRACLPLGGSSKTEQRVRLATSKAVKDLKLGMKRLIPLNSLGPNISTTQRISLVQKMRHFGEMVDCLQSDAVVFSEPSSRRIAMWSSILL